MTTHFATMEIEAEYDDPRQYDPAADYEYAITCLERAKRQLLEAAARAGKPTPRVDVWLWGYDPSDDKSPMPF